MRSPRTLLFGLVGAALTASMVTAASADPTPAIKARQAQMQLYGFNLGTLGAMAQGNVPYDAAVASVAAKNLAALTHLDASLLWPAGSDIDSVEGTRALPDLWANFPDVGTKVQAVQVAANEMAEVAGFDLASLQAAMGPLGAACGACHKAYRAPE